MKKIFTLMVAVGMVTFASAQQGQKTGSFKDTKKEIINSHTVQAPAFGKGKTSGYETTSFSTKERDAQIQKINREYDQKIAAVKKNRHMRQQEKTKQVRSLENQRSQEIKQVQLRWEQSNQHNNGWGQKTRGHY